jgi:UDP-N-acetylmuramate dehydrogenase
LHFKYTLMSLNKKHNLLLFNTFGIEAYCQKLVVVKTVKSLQKILAENTLPLYLLGGGSNILFTKEYYNWLFIKNNIKGIKISKNTEGVNNDDVIVEVGAGENWHTFVLWALQNNLGGVENLSLIPGTIGAAPIQNIGAYGVELKDIFVKLEALNLQTLDVQTFTYEDCQFGYRHSIFKTDLKGTYCITKVYLKLKKTNHLLHTQYGDIQRTLTNMGIEKPTIQDISKAVVHIRQSKLPDPSVLGNAGSFFKNPEISQTQLDSLKKQYPNMVGYPTANGVKVAAGWLIEHCGWKGKRFGNIGVHAQQALVLVNYGGGKGLEIKGLSEKIQASVLDKFGIELMPEVNIV